MAQQVVISRIQHRRGFKENLPQPLLPGELALVTDEGEIWIGGDPNVPPWGIRVYDISAILIAETIVQGFILDVEFDGTFDQQNFNTLVGYLTTAPTPAVVLEPEDILYDGLQHVFIIADPTVDVQNTLIGITAAIQNGANPVAPKFVSSAFLGDRAPFPDPAFDVVDGVFLLGSITPESNARQAANAALLVNRYNGAGIVTTISNIRVPTAGATVGTLAFRDVYVEDADPWNNWSATGSFSAENTIDNLTFVSGAGIDIDIDTDNKALRITNTSVAAALNLFSDVVVTDDDTGLTWAGLGTISASGNSDTLTIVSGSGIEIETDLPNNALIINSLSASDAFAIVTDGTNSAMADGVDTLYLRSANNLLDILVTNDDMTYGDNALFTINESNIDHDQLTNYEINEHIDWTIDSGFEISLDNLDLLALKNSIVILDPDVFINHANIEITGELSITGGGDLTLNRTLSLVNDVLSPGNDFYYGTDAGGVKGWHELPTGVTLDTIYEDFVPTETEFTLDASTVIFDDVVGFSFDIDSDSDIIFVDYSLNSGGAVGGSNNFTAIGTLKIVANANAETGLATLINEQTDVRDTAYTGDVDFQAVFEIGSPNRVQIQYTNTFSDDVNMRIIIRRWMSY